MRIPVDIHAINKKFTVALQPSNAYKLEFVDHLMILFIDQTHYEILVFAIINLQIYNIILSKWKHGIGTIDITTFNEELSFI